MKMFFNQSWSRERRRDLRRDMTDPERILWSALRHKAFGVKVRRQQGIGPYIADFYVAKLQLVIEVDGDSHFSSEGLDYDAERDAYMRSAGITVLRFTNGQVRENLDGVLAAIQDVISPPAKGESEGV